MHISSVNLPDVWVKTKAFARKFIIVFRSFYQGTRTAQFNVYLADFHHLEKTKKAGCERPITEDESRPALKVKSKPFNLAWSIGQGCPLLEPFLRKLRVYLVLCRITQQGATTTVRYSTLILLCLYQAVPRSRRSAKKSEDMKRCQGS